MGLCKCPKRKTTSHFCFHHCVNVCEHCIVNNHTTCVVKSYTTWLKEASGSISSSSSVSTSALCGVCQKQFVLTPKEFENLTTDLNSSSPVTKTAIRLLCYHVVHARCLSVYVKKQMKEQNILKCPSCAHPLWLQNQLQNSNDTAEVDCNELSPVAFQLYKHLLDHGTWWGNALITNENVEDIEKYLLEDEDNSENTLDEKSEQLFENQSTLEIKAQMDSAFNNIPSLTLAQTIQSPNSNNSYYYNYNNSETAHTTSNSTTINHRSNTHQTNQPVHHRLFNNNYGIDSTLTTQQQCLFVDMTNAQSSDLNSRHTVTSSTPLLINNDNNLNNDEQQDPSGKNRPKKFNNQFWSFSYQRIFQYFCGANNSTTRVAILIMLCTFIIVILLVAITSYTRSNNEIFDNNSIDYGGD